MKIGAPPFLSAVIGVCNIAAVRYRSANILVRSHAQTLQAVRTLPRVRKPAVQRQSWKVGNPNRPMASSRWKGTLALLILTTFLALSTGHAESPPPVNGIIPKPVHVEARAGSFPLHSSSRIVWETANAKATARYLAEALRRGTGLNLRVREGAAKQGDLLITTAQPNAALGNEGYQLDVTPDRATLRAPHTAGLFYAVQTLRQLLPPDTFGPHPAFRRNGYTVPCVHIEDYPRFAWRGMHLDVSRHFFDAAFVKRYLDYLALHKMNVFHWHLSDDDGWRVEIKKYPRLTQVAAWRGLKEALPPSYGSGDHRYGGFYTQKQIREIVQYAAERHILIIPEIDVPAHCRAVTVAYPELLCAGDPYRFKSVQDVPANVLCPSQEKTYAFLDEVFGELASLFPGPYLHVGGDERPVGPWEQCERCQKRMKEEHLADGKILQDRFLRRLQDLIRAHGKRIIGWDELDHDTVLEKDYTIMAWNSVQAGIAAAQKGYPVIMAPSPFTYFDLSYNEDPAEPGQRWAGVISVEKVYSFDPKPGGLPADVAARILGVHGCLWSETLVTPDRPEYMVFPRLCALAEIGWTPQNQRTWGEFWSRLSSYHLARLDAAGIAYRIPLPIANRTGDKVSIALPYPDALVRYTIDGSEPSPMSPSYQHPLAVPAHGMLKLRTFRPNGRASRTITAQQSIQFGP
jgi:hexosaminidase